MIVESHTSKASNLCKDSGTGAHFFNENVFKKRKKKGQQQSGEESDAR